MNPTPTISEARPAADAGWWSADDSQYRVGSDVEVVYILNGLRKSAVPISAFFNRRREFLVTAVLFVSEERRCVVLDTGAGTDANARILQHLPVHFVCDQEGVRIQFDAHKMETVAFEGKPAFQIPLPSDLTKFQRREYYRLPTPVVNPVRCEIPAQDDEPRRLVVSDISLGGLCLVGELAAQPPSIGTVLRDCRVPLPDVGTLYVDLTVRNTYVVTLKNGAVSRRTGVQFVKLGPAQEAMVQRYIIRQERERRMRTD